jgi:hypothetical protein
MSITIQNLRIIPYGQKDTLRPVFGDTMHLTFRLADAPLDGDRYLLGLDYERILFPTMRPLCAYTEDYTASQNDVSFDLAINTERFALWASTLKKPTPIWLQLVRVRGEEYTTILLDDILALPSVVDGANMVFPGTPLEDILGNKADLVDGKVPLSQLPPIGFEQVQSDWDESDSSDVTYIRNKPSIGEARWGSIEGDLSSQTDLADALDGKANLVQGKVDINEIPIKANNNNCLVVSSDKLFVQSAPTGIINGKNSKIQPIVPFYLDYAVRSVLPNVTTIPAATTAYSLLDASATTNNHSWQYSHAPEAASTYVFPAVTNTAVAHRIKLTIDFTAVQTYSFEDSQGAAIAPLFTPTISAGDVYEFRCEWSSVQSKWLIYPCKQGAVSDDYVMQSQVGAANGVAGLDSGGKVPREELYLGDNTNPGILKVIPNCGIIVGNGQFGTNPAQYSAIDGRRSGDPSPGLFTINDHFVIVPASINYAVTAALTDAHKIQLTDAQKLSAQDTLGVGAAPIIGTTAPTTSTVGAVGQLYVNTTTSKTYHCTAVNVDDTDPENVVTTYTWTDDVNANGGTIERELIIASGNDSYHPYLNVRNRGVIVNGQTHLTSDWSITGLFINGSGNVTGGTSNTHGVILSGYWLSGYASNKTQTVLGKYNVARDALLTVGNGSAANARSNAYELDWSGNQFIAGGHQQGVTTIPAATTAYTLTDGMQSHVPSSASTYTLPAVTDNARTHECILTVRFSASVQTYAFEDSAGNTLTPLPLAGTIADGSVVAFRCTWEALLGQWVIMPVMLGTYAEVTP